MAPSRCHSDGQSWYGGIAKVCGDGTVSPADKASYALYTYTPWIGLAGGGNKLFWTVYCQYFGDPLAVDAAAPTTTLAGADAAWHSKAVTLTLTAVDNAGGTGWQPPSTSSPPVPGPLPRPSPSRPLPTTAMTAPTWCPIALSTTPATGEASQLHREDRHYAADHDRRRRRRTVARQGAYADLRLARTARAAAAWPAPQYRLDGGAWTKATTLTLPAPADHSGDGAHTWSIAPSMSPATSRQSQSCTVRIDTRRPQPVAAAATVTSGRTARLLYRIRDARPGSPTANVTIRVLNGAGHLVRKLKASAVPVDTRSTATFACHLAAGHYRFVRLRGRRRRQRPGERGLEHPHRPLGARRSHACLSGDDEVGRRH